MFLACDAINKTRTGSYRQPPRNYIYAKKQHPVFSSAMQLRKLYVAEAFVCYLIPQDLQTKTVLVYPKLLS